jgi:hypothetical protein
MAFTTYTPYNTIIASSWLNDVNVGIYNTLPISVKELQFNGGAVGNGIADDTAAVAAALAYAQANGGGIVYFPSGKYKISSKLTYTHPNSTADITLQGAGSGQSQLIWAGGQGLQINHTSAFQSTHIRDLGFMTGSVNTGAGLTLNQQQVTIAIPGNTAPNDITNCIFWGSDGLAETNYWATAIQVNSVSNINFNGVMISGPFAAGYNTVGIGVALQATSTAIGVVYNFNGCTVNNLGAGLDYGLDIQGVSVNQCNFTGNSVGILSTGTTGGAQLDVWGSQFNCSSAVTISSTAEVIYQFMFTHNDVYVPNSSTGLNLAAVGGGCVIANNNFGPTSTSNVNSNAIIVGTTVAGPGATITGNSFWAISDIAVWLLSTSSYCNVQSNSYLNCGTNVNNSGSNNTVGGGSQ